MHEPSNEHIPEPLNQRRAILAGIGGLAAGAIMAGRAQAGPLNPPPGPVAPTPGPEPRIPIGDATTPGDANCLFRITQPGSYYFTGNIQAPPSSTKIGIMIQSGGVSIDLMGYALRGVASSGDGIAIADPGQFNVIAITNGTIENWGRDGINLYVGLGGRSWSNLIEGVRVLNNGGTGIDAGIGSVVRSCTAELNESTGIVALDGIIHACTSRNNGRRGFASARVVADSVAEGNGDAGINCDNGSVVMGSNASGNAGSGIEVGQGGTVQSCTAFNNGTHAIEAVSRCSVLDCTASYSDRDNIVVGSECVVRGNTSFEAGQSAFAAAILITGSLNRVEDNHCLDSDIGIHAQGSGNFIARNMCGGNSTNWIVAAGNSCFVVQAATTSAISGNAGGASPGSSNPNTNYTL